MHSVKANYLASPPLVVAFALAGSVDVNLMDEPIGKNAKGEKGSISATSGRRRKKSAT